MKSEPSVYAIDDLRRDKTTLWDGVRNYQARNFMRDQMRIGDQVLFYHSNCAEIGVAGLMEVSETNVVDPTQFDRKSHYYDPKATKANPRWQTVRVRYRETFLQIISLDKIKQDKVLANMVVAKKGNRLSITPVTKRQFDRVCALGRRALVDSK